MQNAFCSFFLFLLVRGNQSEFCQFSGDQHFWSWKLINTPNEPPPAETISDQDRNRVPDCRFCFRLSSLPFFCFPDALSFFPGQLALFIRSIGIQPWTRKLSQLHVYAQPIYCAIKSNHFPFCLGISSQFFPSWVHRPVPIEMLSNGFFRWYLVFFLS